MLLLLLLLFLLLMLLLLLMWLLILLLLLMMMRFWQRWWSVLLLIMKVHPFPHCSSLTDEVRQSASEKGIFFARPAEITWYRVAFLAKISTRFRFPIPNFQFHPTFQPLFLDGCSCRQRVNNVFFTNSQNTALANIYIATCQSSPCPRSRQRLYRDLGTRGITGQSVLPFNRTTKTPSLTVFRREKKSKQKPDHFRSII